MSVYVLHGLKPWIIQRITAIFIALFVIYLGVIFVYNPSISQQQLHNWLFDPVNTILVGLFIISLLLHAWIGIRDVVLDYLHNVLLRMFTLTLVATVLIASGLWSLKILLLTVIT